MKGLYPKYTITNNETGEEVRGAFILKPENDPHARTALAAYATSIQEANPILGKQIREWMAQLNEGPTRFNLKLSSDKPASTEDGIGKVAYTDGFMTISVLSEDLDDDTLDSLEGMCKLIADDLSAKGVSFGYKIQNDEFTTLRSSDSYHRNAKGEEPSND